MAYTEYKISEYFPDKEPFYIDVAGETKKFKAAYANQLPVMLKGPTGCGKTKFMERMAWELKRLLVTVPCHEDLTADDLKGRHLLDKSFLEGLALIAVKNDGILYLDEIVEARNDTTVVIHPMTDHRRYLIMERLGKVFVPSEKFMIVMSYNPNYQRKTKDLKQSTRQRFPTIRMNYPPKDIETEIVATEAGIDKNLAGVLVNVGNKVRNLKGKGLEEGASTRLLIYAGKLIKSGIEPRDACDMAILDPLTDDNDVFTDIRSGLEDLFTAYFGK